MLANDQVDGVIVINKPRGVTSFDVVAKVRRAIGQKKLVMLAHLIQMCQAF